MENNEMGGHVENMEREMRDIQGLHSLSLC